MALWRMFWVAGAAAALFLLCRPLLAPAEHPVLSLPIVCEPGKTCFIQSYVDHDPGEGVADFACGSATYNAHKGTDFRILSAARVAESVAVVASAEGTVKGVREGVEDYLIKDGEEARVANRECGNGVVLDHGNGWETQYCHMRRGSVRVAKGQSVKRGDRLGDVGYSGLTQFAHVHFELRRGSEVIDPFSGTAKDSVCEKNPAAQPGFWDGDAAKAFVISAGDIITAGFAGEAPDEDALEVSDTNVSKLSAQSPALLLYARFINLRAGDRIRFTVNGPQGFAEETTSDPLGRNKAGYFGFFGKRRKEAAWPGGRYEGRIEVLRDRQTLISRSVSQDLP